MPHDNRPVMVCLISRQTMQNLLPILQYRPQQVVCLTTREEDGSRKHLADILHTQHIALDAPLYVDAYVPESTTQACHEIIARHGPDRLIANLTGGTKVMSLAAFRVFAAAHVPCLYTDTPHRRLLFLHPDDRVAETLQTRVDVLTYLRAHGQLASLRGSASRLSVPNLAAFLGQHIAELEPFLSRLRYELRDTPGQTRVRVAPQGRQRQAVAGEALAASHARRTAGGQAEWTAGGRNCVSGRQSAALSGRGMVGRSGV